MRRTWLIFSQAVTVAVAVLFVVGTFKPQWLGGAPDVLGMARPPASGVVTVGVSSPGASAPLQPLTQAAKRAAPAVVSITASKAPPRRSAQQPHSQDPWFRFFFGQPGQQPEPQVGLGSGVIVSSDGYLLTNHHVVEGADQVSVRLADGREAEAQLIGTDPESDIAVLKIGLDNLPSLTLGAIEQLQVGDAVLAIGNPFNVGQTVTSGIVSALGRSGLGLSTFENFIQTDAAINPGNSGGALVDAAGNLVGINSAIYSQSGGSMGIGFAIPIDLAQHVMDGLVRDGQVTRGWIGVQPRDLDPEFAQSFNLPVSQGVLITGVLQNGPASQAGMRPGDVVTTIAGRPVRSTSQLLLAVSELKPQSQAQIGVQRGSETLQLTVTVAQRPKSPR
ncbi:trypsin-like peptidase domain-containing protein [Ideonella sp. 4Y16]|uniref:Trypsin-like peptidase domain-containing protein n=1 Tax=Ideonella alba TaxID=2824118 RepID=A0A940YDD0_9BURK|nr:trypsin-like peptidase domain-containing protein [Ideonella alba]MBQ0931076.1 trypsin-like peptidase domain-containing protein [Ideonella alba]MBQ0944227.1 trypsin-like peptidase domain-containing protein [Ideonella alba]